MIFVDTSALLAILNEEADGEEFATKLADAGEAICAGHVILEASTRLATLHAIQPTFAHEFVVRLLREAAVSIVPITEEVAHFAVIAFERYGKGRGGDASLNFGDCLSYACAKAHGADLLFKGDDFSRTDMRRA